MTFTGVCSFGICAVVLDAMFVVWSWRGGREMEAVGKSVCDFLIARATVDVCLKFLRLVFMDF